MKTSSEFSSIGKRTKKSASSSRSSLDSETDSSYVKSLTRFYESIPAYCEVYHLPPRDFYDTLDRLKKTCDEFKTKSTSPSLTSPTLLSTKSSSSKSILANRILGKTSVETIMSDITGKEIKTEKKKMAKGKKKRSLKKSEKSEQVINLSNEEQKHAIVDSLLKDDIKKSKKKKPVRSKSANSIFHLGCIRPFTPCENKEHAKKIAEISSKSSFSSTTQIDKIGIEKNLIMDLKKRMNILPTVTVSKTIAKEGSSSPFKPWEEEKSKDTEKKISISEENPLKENVTSTTTPLTIINNNNDLSIINYSTSSESNCTVKSVKKSKKVKEKSQNQLSFFDMDLSPKHEKDTARTLSVSPVHPGARLNLAATLRAESTRKRSYNCSLCLSPKESFRHFDWEVRKTPAWKTLGLIETNKEDIMNRLATRRAEQKLLRKEHELNMELMRQRVKAAPLLLEGQTYWTPRPSGHSCYKDLKKKSTPRRGKKKSGLKCPLGKSGLHSSPEDCKTCKQQNPSRLKIGTRNCNPPASSNHILRGDDHNSGDSDDLDSVDRAYL